MDPLIFSLCALVQTVQTPPPLSYVEITGAISTLDLERGFLEIEAGDVNRDGCPDLVSVGDHGSPNIHSQEHGVTVWLGDCAGGWTLLQTGDFGYGGTALGDVNADGWLDVAYGIHHNYSGSDFGDQILEVALGDGTGGNWLPWDDGLASQGESWGMFGTDLGDVDQDGDLDLGSVSFGCCAGLHVYRNEGNGTWSQSFGFLNGNSDSRFQFADFNGDGHLDLCAGHSSGAIWLGDGLGGFSRADGNLPGSHSLGVSAGDIDLDGRDEFAFMGGSQPRVYGWSSGDVWTNKSANLSSILIPNVQEFCLADMDVDGRAELVVLGKGNVGIYAADAQSNWNLRWRGSVPGLGSRDAELIQAGTDLDHNGLPDLWLVQREERGFLGEENAHHVLAEASTPTHLDIRGLAPSRGRVWRGGSLRFADWTSRIPPHADRGTVDIFLSTNLGLPPYQSLASGLPNNGRAQVRVPMGVQSTSCRLLYVVTTSTLGRRRALGPTFAIMP